MINKMRKMDKQGFTLIELMIVIAIIGILAAIAIPNFIAYRNKTFCTKAESDANNIAADVASYFAIPTNTSVQKADIKFNPGKNTFSIGAQAPNTSITITVTDVSGRCPNDYINANPVNANTGDGWTNHVYQKVIKE